MAHHRKKNVRLGPRWNLKERPNATLILANGYAAVLPKLIASSRTSKIAFLTDTRRIHKRIFHRLTPDGFEEYAGTYRGEPGTSLERRFALIRYRTAEGFMAETRLVHPSRVASEMDRLATYIAETFSQEWNAEQYLWRSVRIFAHFSHIHPYLNGNGQTSRLMMHVMAHLGGISVSPNWSLHVRPYGNGVGYCLQSYPSNPELLFSYFKRWFGKWSAE